LIIFLIEIFRHLFAFVKRMDGIEQLLANMCYPVFDL
jgi:hypothetical protein